MTGGAADLEAELAKRQKELEGNVAKHAKRTAQGLAEPEAAAEFDPSEMVSKMKVFRMNTKQASCVVPRLKAMTEADIVFDCKKGKHSSHIACSKYQLLGCTSSFVTLPCS